MIIDYGCLYYYLVTRVSERGRGIEIVLSDEVEISQHGEYRSREPIVTHGAGGFVGELGQLSGQPFLIDAYCQSMSRGW